MALTKISKGSRRSKLHGCFERNPFSAPGFAVSLFLAQIFAGV